MEIHENDSSHVIYDLVPSAFYRSYTHKINIDYMNSGFHNLYHFSNNPNTYYKFRLPNLKLDKVKS